MDVCWLFIEGYDVEKGFTLYSRSLLLPAKNMGCHKIPRLGNTWSTSSTQKNVYDCELRPLKNS